LSAFESAWAKIIEEYKAGKFDPVTERDLHLHLACNLREKLQAYGWGNWVHMDFPVPLQPSRLNEEPFNFGTVVQKGVRKPDIVVINTEEIPPWRIHLIAEVKYIRPRSFIGGWFWRKLFWAAIEKDVKNYLRWLKESGNLGKISDIARREVRRYSEHGREELTEPVIHDLKKVSDLMKVYNNAGMGFPGYVCVLDVVYGPLTDCLKELMERHEREFSDVKLLYFSAYESFDLLNAVDLLLLLAETLAGEAR